MGGGGTVQCILVYSKVYTKVLWSSVESSLQDLSLKTQVFEILKYQIVSNGGKLTRRNTSKFKNLTSGGVCKTVCT